MTAPRCRRRALARPIDEIGNLGRGLHALTVIVEEHLAADLLEEPGKPRPHTKTVFV